MGSTSIPKLSAKPILDILLVFESSEEQLRSLDTLENLGFTHKGDGVALVHGCEPDPKRHFYSYYNDSKEIDYIHLHTYVKDHPDIEGFINFRDKLIQDPRLRSEYESLKKDLYEQGKTRKDYTKSKEFFIKKVLEKINPDFSIRAAKKEDAKEIAKVHINSWHSTYTGIIPQNFLDTLDINKRESLWCKIIESDKDSPSTFVATKNNQVVGFVNFGKNREKDLPFDGEINAIYLLLENQGLGIGKSLFNKAALEMKNQKLNSFIIQVLKENPSCTFYEKMGGSLEQEKTESIGGREFIISIYSWK